MKVVPVNALFFLLMQLGTDMHACRRKKQCVNDLILLLMQLGKASYNYARVQTYFRLIGGYNSLFFLLVQLGTDKHSWGFGSTGKKSHQRQFDK